MAAKRSVGMTFYPLATPIKTTVLRQRRQHPFFCSSGHLNVQDECPHLAAGDVQTH
jgi:hypothetical protein